MNTNSTIISDTATNEQKKDWFLRLNPNGKLSLYSNLPLLILFRPNSNFD
jgi:hypothetical protein